MTEPLDLDEVQRRMRDAGTFADVGSLEDIAFELIAEVERLRALAQRIAAELFIERSTVATPEPTP